MASQRNSTKCIKKSKYLSFSSYSPKLRCWEHSQIHSMRPPDTKTRQGQYINGKLQANISDEHRRKTLQNISKLISTKYEKDHTPWSSGIYPRRQEWFNIHKQLNVIHHINKRKTKNDMIISVNTEECIWQHSISIYDKNSHQKKKTFIKVSIEGTYLNIIKTIYDKPTANIKQTFCLFLLPSAAAGTPIKPCLNLLSGL